MRAGKVVSGDDTTLKELKKGKLSLVIVADDASDNTKKLFKDKSSYRKINQIYFATKVELGLAIGKAVSYTHLMVDYEYKLSQQGYNRIKANLSTNNQNSTKYLQATREDLSKYLNPQTFSTNANGRLQFLKIDKYREGITASELNAFFNKYCKSNSVFINKGQAFVEDVYKRQIPHRGF